MKIKDVTLKDIKRKAVYVYVDEENIEIQEVRLRKNSISKNSGYFLIGGKIRIADNTEYYAILGISSDDSGELFEAHFFINGEWVSQKDEQFLKKLGKKKNQIFPYKYHLNAKVGGDANLSQQF